MSLIISKPNLVCTSIEMLINDIINIIKAAYMHYSYAYSNLFLSSINTIIINITQLPTVSDEHSFY